MFTTFAITAGTAAMINIGTVAANIATVGVGCLFINHGMGKITKDLLKTTDRLDKYDSEINKEPEEAVVVEGEVV